MNLSTEQLFITEAAKALLDNPQQSPFLNLTYYQLWDCDGMDSWSLVKQLFSRAVTKIAPFQSLDVIFTGYQYSVLRLGEEHFRLGLYGELGTYGGLTFAETIAQAREGLQVRAAVCDRNRAIALPTTLALDILPNLTAITQEQLLAHRAIPVEIEGIPVLLWRHQLLSQPIVELHAATGEIEAIAHRVSAACDRGKVIK
jgi:hypothetical protein